MPRRGGFDIAAAAVCETVLAAAARVGDENLSETTPSEGRRKEGGATARPAARARSEGRTTANSAHFSHVSLGVYYRDNGAYNFVLLQLPLSLAHMEGGKQGGHSGHRGEHGKVRLRQHNTFWGIIIYTASLIAPLPL